MLHLRFDGDQRRNAEIREQRLNAAEIVAVERGDEERFGALRRGCERLIGPDEEHAHSDRLFRCGAGSGSFSVGYDGTFRLCSSLWHPGPTYDLRGGTVAEAGDELTPRVRDLRSRNSEFLEEMQRLWHHQSLPVVPGARGARNGRMDEWVEGFCAVAQERAKAIGVTHRTP